MEKKSGGFKIKCDDQYRLKIWEMAWKTHRRTILSTLPVLVEIVKGSVGQLSGDLELYPNHQQCHFLRRGIGKATGELGLHSQEAIENVLIQFAADKNRAVQEVAAVALLQWQGKRDEELFALLR